MKRILTEDGHATTKLAAQFQSNDATAGGDVAASIRAASMRARKTVTEGYLTPPPSSPLKQAPVSLTGAASYHFSARENNRQIFTSPSGIYSPLPSPSKRKRCHPNSHDDHDDQQSITPFFITPKSQHQAHLTAELRSGDMEVDRPMKPLRRSGRIREMSPLPLTCSLFRRETEMNSHHCEEEFTNMHPPQRLSLDSASDNERQ